MKSTKRSLDKPYSDNLCFIKCISKRTSFLQCSSVQFAKDPNHGVYSDYWVYWENHLIFFDEVFCLLLPEAFPMVDMTRGHWPWSRVIIKNLKIKVAFLLGKRVLAGIWRGVFSKRMRFFFSNRENCNTDDRKLAIRNFAPKTRNFFFCWEAW